MDNNDQITPEEQERIELERKIELLEMSRINLRVPPNIFDVLLKQAEFHGIEIEEHCVNVLLESLQQHVGKATITAPNIAGHVHKKIMGPSSVSTVTRA